ncbi:transposase IS116/IS110/IS902 family protein, partial [Salinisphaera sp. S4-8]|uniref:IS110 family transposase n=1 Tax=Salinisphaera sp. S4-8 TaxID=633357 RepID=UPI00333EBB63
MQQITELGIDIAKNVFELCGLNAAHEVVYRKRVRRRQFLATVLNLDAKRIYIEACGSSHHWARQLQRENRSVTLLPPHQVKPFNTGNKNDANDALAIAVAGPQAKIRPVAIKSFEQQDIQALHRVREQVKKQRTEVINQARDLLAEYGQVLPVGVSGFRRGVP